MYKKIFTNTATSLYVGMISQCLCFRQDLLLGLYIFGFKLGELIIGFCLILSVIILFVPKRIFANYFSNTDYLNVHKALILSFVIIVLLTNSSLSNLYTYRSSSFIWTICIIYLGLYFLNNKELEKYYLFIFLPIPFINFLFATGFYPNIIMDFYINFLTNQFIISL